MNSRWSSPPLSRSAAACPPRRLRRPRRPWPRRPARSPPADIHETVLATAPAAAKVHDIVADRDHAVWIEDLNGKKSVWKDSVQIGDSYDDILYVRPSDEWKRVAFTAKRRGMFVLVVDGVERTREWEKMTAPTFTDSSNAVAVGACDGHKCHLVVDSTLQGAQYKEITSLSLSPGGAHSVYFGRNSDGWMTVRDGKELGPAFDDVWSWRWSPDGKHLAVAGKIDRVSTWVVDTVQGPTFLVVGPVAFSRDSKHWAFGGTDQAGLPGLTKMKTASTLVLDGQSRPDYAGGGFAGEVMRGFELRPGLHELHALRNGMSDPRFTTDGSLLLALRRAMSSWRGAERGSCA